STGAKLSKGSLQQSQLQRREFSDLFGSQPPADLRVALQRPSAGTRCVHQNLVKQPEEGKWLGCVAGNPPQILPRPGMQTAGHLKPVPVEIRGEYGSGAVFQASNLRTLASHACTQVKAHVVGFEG